MLEKFALQLGNKTIQIAPPKLSMEERRQRRLCFRNENHLYRHEGFISCYHPDSPFPVLKQSEWWKDGWDALDYGRDFDFKRPFFEQMGELMFTVPRPALSNNKSENSEFCHYVDGNKNCYLFNVSNYNEDCYYGAYAVHDTNTVDIIWANHCELSYECIEAQHCYNVRYAQGVEKCVDSAFLQDCRNLKNCLFCVNLRSKEYHIFNQKVSPEKYKEIWDYVFSGSPEGIAWAKEQFALMLERTPIRRFATIVNSENCRGDHIYNSQNVVDCYDVYDSQDIRDSHDGVGSKDCADVFSFDGCELCYESMSLIGYGYRFTIGCRDSYDIWYSENCHNSKNLFGCVGLRNKQYCVFNKQYTKEEYEALVERIVTHMQSTGEWGEFFPATLSPFAYNETTAYDYYPMNKQAVEARGWRWRELSDKNNQVQIIPQEKRFYERMGLPEPSLSFLERHRARLAKRLPRQMWERECAKCKSGVHTAFSPDRSERVLCDDCYLKEVY